MVVVQKILKIGLVLNDKAAHAQGAHLLTAGVDLLSGGVYDNFDVSHESSL